MVRQVLESSEEIASNVVEWKDAEGWTEDILYCIMVCIDYWEIKHGPFRASDPIRKIHEHGNDDTHPISHN